MAVYKRSYRAYAGELTPRWSRFLILTRYAMRGVFKSRFVTGLYVVSFFYPLAMIALLYVNHNARLLTLLKFERGQILEVAGQFFFVLMTVQCAIAFLMTAFIGPNMIAPDLANNSLPLYFSRPLSRAEYVFGRACAILILLSLITWVPGIAVFGVEASLSGASWAWQNLNFLQGILLGSFLWIAVLALLALALSAWVRWKLVAGALILAAMFLTSGFATAVEVVMRTKVGHYLDPALLVTFIYARAFGVRLDYPMTAFSASIALIAFCAFFAFLLQRKVRAFEVVR